MFTSSPTPKVKMRVFGRVLRQDVLLSHVHIDFADGRSAVGEEGDIVCRERLGGTLKYYYRQAA